MFKRIDNFQMLLPEAGRLARRITMVGLVSVLAAIGLPATAQQSLKPLDQVQVADLNLGGNAMQDLFSQLGSKDMSPVEVYHPGLSFVADGKLIAPANRSGFVAKVTPELLQHYELILFVNKSKSGPFAQRLIWLKPGDPQDRTKPWEATKIWKISTGRERQEKEAFTTTPPGIFNLHPTRQIKDYRSRLYKGAKMPYSVFLDYRTLTRKGYGIAFHATGATGQLGSRASGGCIRLRMKNARNLFETLRSDYRGRVPVMEMAADGKWNLEGRMAYDERGLPIMINGLKALVIIEESENLVASAQQ